MAEQPVNFEQERQRILAEIEARAKARGGELTLQDWLKAAEEVMPDGAAISGGLMSEANERLLGAEEVDEDRVSLRAAARPRRRSRAQGRTARMQNDTPQDMPKQQPRSEHGSRNEEDGTNMGQKNTIWMGVIASTVLVAILGAGGLAFYKLQGEIKTLGTKLAEMEARLQKFEQSQSSSDTASLAAITARLDALERKALPVDAQQKVSDQVHSELTEANVVTEAVLDAKLAQFSQRIEQVIDKRFATLLVQLKSLRATAAVPTVKAHAEEKSAVIREQNDEAMPIPEPAQPDEPQVPVVERADKKKTSPDISVLMESEQWVAQQPADHWTLQLASVLDKASLDHMIRNKQLNEAKIIRQIRDGQTRYVLIQGSFAERTSAKEAAAAIRQRTGISPWVRTFKPLQANLPR
ncbi:Sporulation related domain-containing protein [Sulfurivirga caldicuralii]|uniref:Sporulation related domain-containing protein n=1 Tax=Sulfurivirga caldicuralii TaxID=364032 RepID=A0A1N6FAV2_9GAMM|nr:SPOR domain-containing protein [Sulfurivirga caldicuralii]SIN92403.1 Sporulation related domain-containing protein [Sulfurivirga caldicuralii]